MEVGAVAWELVFEQKLVKTLQVRNGVFRKKDLANWIKGGKGLRVGIVGGSSEHVTF